MKASGRSSGSPLGQILVLMGTPQTISLNFCRVTASRFTLVTYHVYTGNAVSLHR